MHSLYLINEVSGVIENVILAGDDYTPPDGMRVSVADGQWDIGEIHGVPKPEKTPAELSAEAKAVAAAEIKRLEAESMIPRVTREFMLDLVEQTALSKGMTLEQLTAANAGYRKLKALDDQIKSLRAQL